MGRRALPKLDPELDLSRHLVPVEALPRPWDAAVLFGRQAPLEIEVGSGKGLFLTAAAAACPGHDFLGIEIAKKYAAHAAGRLARRGLNNARLVPGDALWIIRELVPAASVRAVHVYFPDPWWKKRHHKRRVMNEAFVGDVIRVLVAGGELHFWTDVAEYFTATQELLRGFPALAGPLPVAERPAEHDLDYRTHFERRMRQHDLPVYRSLYRREG